MFVYTKKKSCLGPLGFDSLSFFSEDEIKYTGFEPSEFEINLIGKFLNKINQDYLPDQPVQLMISKIGGFYCLDVKASSYSRSRTASSQGSTLGVALSDLENKMFQGVKFDLSALELTL